MNASARARAEQVIAYYGHMTENYNAYAEGTFSWHYGIWEDDTQSHADALLNNNRRLVRGAALGPGDRVLDIGCGVGGFATWVAAAYGCHVDAITVVGAHVEEARALADKRRVAHLCTFHEMDMNELDVAAGRYQLITTQETLMYAEDKRAFLEGVRRALAPGGRWHAIDMTKKAGPLTAAEEREHRVTCEAWAMTPLWSADEVEALAVAVGFVDFRAEDVTARTMPSVRRILDYCRGADEHIAALESEKLRATPSLRALARHVDGGRSYSLGLARGYFRHCCYYTQAPTQPR